MSPIDKICAANGWQTVEYWQAVDAIREIIKERDQLRAELESMRGRDVCHPVVIDDGKGGVYAFA